MSQQKLEEGDFGFPGGLNSDLDPSLLPPGYYARGENVVTRGATPQCRPGYRCMTAIPAGHIQGGTVFKPKVGQAVIVFAVSGLIYVSEYPFKSYRQLEDVQFSSTARQIFFKQAEKSVTYNADGSLSLTPSYNLLVIQDGGSSPAAVFDGTKAVHDRSSTGIPMGGPMEWVGDRLWVASDAKLYASDIADPTSFTEFLYIASPRNFVLPNRITALSKSPASAFPQLLCFTGTNTTLFQAGIRNRAVWSTTPDFQREILPKIGCAAARSLVTHYGYLWWYSSFGLTSLDAASQSYISSELPYRDAEMAESKAGLSSDISNIACGTFENYLLVSVPYEDRLNAHSWCLDNTTLVSGKQGGLPTWNSFWTGTRPVEWMSDTINGQSRIFFLSSDYDGVNRLWEAFSPDRLDNGCPITWWVETRALSGSLVGKLKEFLYADVFLSELAGLVDVAVFWAGGFRGKYKRILTKRINATRGNLRSGENISADTKLFALKKQSRSLRTQDGRKLASTETLSSAGIESPNEEFKDETFQLLLVGSGPGALRAYNTYSEPPKNEDDSARVEEDEPEENFVRFDGGAAESASFSEAQREFEDDLTVFTSTKTEVVTQRGYTEIATASAESIISQADADKIASCIAIRMASEALEAVVPRLVSKGAAAND